MLTLITTTPAGAVETVELGGNPNNYESWLRVERARIRRSRRRATVDTMGGEQRHFGPARARVISARGYLTSRWRGYYQPIDRRPLERLEVWDMDDLTIHVVRTDGVGWNSEGQWNHRLRTTSLGAYKIVDYDSEIEGGRWTNREAYTLTLMEE